MKDIHRQHFRDLYVLGKHSNNLMDGEPTIRNRPSGVESFIVALEPVLNVGIEETEKKPPAGFQCHERLIEERSLGRSIPQMLKEISHH